MGPMGKAGVLAGGWLVLSGGLLGAPLQGASPPVAEAIRLPAPRVTGGVAVERALKMRRSLREFEGEALGLPELAQLLWAAQGVTTRDGRRSAPSAGALYPPEVYVVAGSVTALPAGVYRHDPAGHRLVRAAAGDRRRALASAALGQDWLASAPAALLIAAVYERTSRKYGARAERYVHFEAGCAAENVALQAEALGLGTVVVGAFDDAQVGRAAALPAREQPLAILPVGRR